MENSEIREKLPEEWKEQSGVIVPIGSHERCEIQISGTFQLEEIIFKLKKSRLAHRNERERKERR